MISKIKKAIVLCLMTATFSTILTAQNKPNIIYILADDAGMYDFGCYGQKIIKTPNIDKLAEEGIRFNNHYTGSPGSAPSRCTLLTGKHTGHAAIRDNYEQKPEGQLPLPKDEITVAEILKKNGYKTAAIGIWGLGYANSEGAPTNQGFDYFFGYLCQRNSQNYYPYYIYENNKKVKLDNKDIVPHQPFNGNPENPADYKKYSGNDYTPDLMTQKAIDFIKQNKNSPFFLYWPTPIPHMPLQVPDDSLYQYDFIEEYGPYLGYKGYLPNYRPRATYAAMISTMDRDIGKILKLLKELNLDKNTIVIFSSDNGPASNGGSDSKYFDSSGDLHGLKGDLYEGGLRVPLIVKWPDRIEAGSTSEHISAFWDFLPTISDICDIEKPKGCDGISFLPTLLNKNNQEKHNFLYWEYLNKKRAIRMGNWKALKKSPFGIIELYNLKVDPNEARNVASENKDIVKKIKNLMRTERTPSKDFPMKGDKLYY